MQVLYERAAGIDVHKKTLVTCVQTPEGKEVHTTGTSTREIEALAAWLEERGVTHVAMEATGVFWQPVYNVLEDHAFELILANAQHIKAVPGRKTDVKDAEWLCDLLRHGLIRASYVPARRQRELRALVRYRKTLIRERADELNRIQKTLQAVNITLPSVVSETDGVSSLAMIRALAAGEDDPTQLAELARGQLRKKMAELREALHGRMSEQQRFLLTEQLSHLDDLEARIARLSEQIARCLDPREAEAVALLDTIPGIGIASAQLIIAEIGTDMSRFRTAAHLASWAGVCPGNHQSGGKRMTGKTRRGDPWLREALVEMAQGAARKRNSYLQAQHRRIAARRGKKRATMAGAHTLLVIVYHVLKDRVPYRELGATYFDERDKAAIARRTKRRLEALGFIVTIQEGSQAA
jgi:transposase